MCEKDSDEDDEEDFASDGDIEKNPWKISKLRSLWQMSKSRLTHSLLAEDVNKYRNINTIQKTLLHMEYYLNHS